MTILFYVHVQVEFFEPFWDSGEARVGELGARGWKVWMLQQERGGWLPPPAGETSNNYCFSLICWKPCDSLLLDLWDRKEHRLIKIIKGDLVLHSQRRRRKRKKMRKR